MKSVLFLCTGNSARSQMAEALANHFLAGCWQAFSAGVKPSPYGVHHAARAVLQELGIDTAELYSKSVDVFQEMPMDLIVTVCDHAAEHCPAWLAEGRTVHVPFADPSHVRESEEAQTDAFRHTRDLLRNTLLTRLDNFCTADST